MEVDSLVRAQARQTVLVVKPDLHPSQCPYAMADRHQLSLRVPGVIVNVVPGTQTVLFPYGANSVIPTWCNQCYPYIVQTTLNLFQKR